jgi:hypothetical protein
MNPYSEHAAGLRELQTELGDNCPSISWAGQTIYVLPGGITLKSKNSVGGLSMDADFKFVCMADDFGATLPTSNQILTYRGNTLKIDSVVLAAGGLQVSIMANHYSKGA